jgi:hypothetical protein
MYVTAREILGIFDEISLKREIVESMSNLQVKYALGLVKIFLEHTSDKARWGAGDDKAKSQIPGLEKAVSIINDILETEKKNA